MINNNQKITYILVSNGSKANIYISNMNKHNLTLINTLESQTARMHSYELGSKKPHGIFERNTPESRVDLRAKEEEKFIHCVAELLNKDAATGQFQSLVLISPPKILGNLRRMLKKITTKSVIKEIKKDLVHMDEQNLKTYIWE